MEECEICEKVKPNKMDIANLIEFNDKEEANAIVNYNDLLERVRESDLPKSKKEIIEKEIYEIIGDELNHQERLKMLYTVVTAIKQSKD